MTKARESKPQVKSLLDDKDVEVWADGSIWHHKKDLAGGGTVQYTQLRGPSPAKEVEEDEEIAWIREYGPITLKILAVIFMMIGILYFVTLVSGRDIGCNSVHGCYIIFPTHR